MDGKHRCRSERRVRIPMAACDASGENCSDIPEAAASGFNDGVYAPPATFAGSTIRVVVTTFSPTGEASASATSAATAVLADATPVASTAAPRSPALRRTAMRSRPHQAPGPAVHPSSTPTSGRAAMWLARPAAPLPERPKPSTKLRVSTSARHCESPLLRPTAPARHRSRVLPQAPSPCRACRRTSHHRCYRTSTSALLRRLPGRTRVPSRGSKVCG